LRAIQGITYSPLLVLVAIGTSPEVSGWTLHNILELDLAGYISRAPSDGRAPSCGSLDTVT
jgi:hypothetical protein